MGPAIAGMRGTQAAEQGEAASAEYNVAELLAYVEHSSGDDDVTVATPTWSTPQAAGTDCIGSLASCSTDFGCKTALVHTIVPLHLDVQ